MITGRQDALPGGFRSVVATIIHYLRYEEFLGSLFILAAHYTVFGTFGLGRYRRLHSSVFTPKNEQSQKSEVGS